MSDAPIATVRLVFTESGGRDFKLPGGGSPSLLYIFKGHQVGAFAETADGRDLTPGTTHDGVRLTFWASEATTLVHPGADFDVWYGGIVGSGSVDSVETARG